MTNPERIMAADRMADALTALVVVRWRGEDDEAQTREVVEALVAYNVLRMRAEKRAETAEGRTLEEQR